MKNTVKTKGVGRAKDSSEEEGSRENLPGELDVVEDDEGALDIEDGAVVHTGRDVVVTGGTGSVDDVVCHFTRIVCCFSC